MNYKKIFGISTVFIILSIVILVSATNTNDTGNSQKYTDNGITYNITTTPYRQDSSGYITIEINSNTKVNKTFTIQDDNNKNISLSLKDNTNSITNTSNFTIPSNGLNKTLTIADNENNNTINLTTEFTGKINFAKLMGTESDTIHVNNSNNTTIQEAINSINETGGIRTIELEGGVYNQSYAEVKLNKSNVTIKNAPDANSIITTYGNGRAFNVSESNTTFNGLTITNTFIEGNGGGIYFSNSNSNNISNCNLTNNKAGGYGGSLYFENGGGNNVIGCNLTNNTANRGAGLYFTDSSNNSLSGCNLTNNTATNYGGGIYFWNSSNNNVSACTLTNNNATSGGGLYFYLNSNNNIVSGCTLTNNKATTHLGGGLYFDESNSNSVSGCTLTNNTAISGGGLFFGGSRGSNDNSVNYNRFYSNNATSNGMDVNIATGNTGNNISCNWWGNNNPTNATSGHAQIVAQNNVVYTNHFVVRLSENDTKNATSSDNTTVDIPASYGDVTLKYELVLNDTNSSVDTYKLPDFSAWHNVSITNKPVVQHTSSLSGFLEKFLNGLFGWVNADETVNAKDPYENTSALPYDNEILSFESIVDNEDLVLNVTSNDNLNPYTNLTLSLSSDNIVLGNSVTLTANLTNVSGNGIPNANVTFNINGTNYTSNTTEDGIATYIFTPDNVGKYNIIAIFNGIESFYNASNSTSKILTVKSPTPPPGKINTNLDLTHGGTSVGDATVTATLTDNNGNGIANESITFNVFDNKGFSKEYTVITDANGKAVLNLNDLPEGLYTITAKFAGDDKYATSNSRPLNINIKSSSTPPESNLDGNNGLRNTGFPLIILLVLTVTGLLYWRRK